MWPPRIMANESYESADSTYEIATAGTFSSIAVPKTADPGKRVTVSFPAFMISLGRSQYHLVEVYDVTYASTSSFVG